MREEYLQMQICSWLKLKYPSVIFTCDLSSGMKLTIGQAVKAKRMRSSRGLPDLMIFEPRGNYNGLFIELKSPSACLYSKDGTLRNEKHLKEQSAILDNLRLKGYYAVFAQGFEDARSKIINYMR